MKIGEAIKHERTRIPMYTMHVQSGCIPLSPLRPPSCLVDRTSLCRYTASSSYTRQYLSLEGRATENEAHVSCGDISGEGLIKDIALINSASTGDGEAGAQRPRSIERSEGEPDEVDNDRGRVGVAQRSREQAPGQPPGSENLKPRQVGMPLW